MGRGNLDSVSLEHLGGKMLPKPSEIDFFEESRRKSPNCWHNRIKPPTPCNTNLSFFGAAHVLFAA
jgi:hypothetical protein